MTSPLSESLEPIVFQIVLGGVGGFLIGYAIRKVLKIAVIVGGGSFFVDFACFCKHN